MITGSNDLNTDEETFSVALKIDLTFKRLVNSKARCLSTMIISTPRRVDMLLLHLVMMLITRRLLRMSTFF